MARHDYLLRIALVLTPLAIGCQQQTGGVPVIWPESGLIGSTAAMAIDSNHIPDFGPVLEHYDLSLDNVTLKFTLPGQSQALAIADNQDPQNPMIQAVFDARSGPASIMNTMIAGPEITIVVFNIPDMQITPPQSVEVHLLVDGQVGFVKNSMTITGTGGNPYDFYSGSEPADLQPRPMLRLRPLAEDPQQATRFDPSWEIGGIEFTIEYPASVSEPEAFPNTEAVRAVAYVGPETSGSAKVILSDPRGFSLPSLAGTSPVEAGEGPLLDIAFTKEAGMEFDETEFAIKDLKVTDRDGALLTPSFSPGTDTTDYFRLIARKNLVE